VLLTSALIVAGWGYFLYLGVIDPNGGINILWPLFGIANQMLAAIALSIATGILIKSGKLKYSWVTGGPLAWLAIVTTVAAWQKITSPDPALGFFAGAADLASKLASGALPAARAAVAPKLIFNQQLDGWLTILFSVIVWLVIADMLRVTFRSARGLPTLASSESPHVARS
jgi:carbon starvation protein